MLNLLKNQTVKKSVLGAALVSAPALAKGAEGSGGIAAGGKEQLGVNQLSLETTPGKNASVCANEASSNSKTGAQIVPSDLSIAVDPFNTESIQLAFTVADIISNDKEQILILAYSQGTSPSPQLPSPVSNNKFMLDLARVEILGIYNIPSQATVAQPQTRLGQADPQPRSKVTFLVNLDPQVLPIYMNNKTNAYLQAALIPAEDYAQGKFANMLLSELETLEFVESNYCQESNAALQMGADGTTVVDTVGRISRQNETTRDGEHK